MARKMIPKVRAITLVELVVVIGLLSFVVLAAISLDLAGRRFFQSGNKESIVLNRLLLSTERIIKDVVQANRFTITEIAAYRQINITQENATVRTPWNGTDDTSGYYRNYIANNTLRYCPPPGGCGSEGNWQLVARGVNCTFTYADSNTALILNITGIYNSSQAPGPDNPELSISSRITLREKPAQ